ncbi:MAG: LysM peptidoglycan-binding domain-containing protein [Myxococcota bacterium]
MSRRWAILASLLVLGLPADAQELEEEAEQEEARPDRASDARIYTHVVRPGETLASIAQRYYGDTKRENVLVADNGLTAEGGAAIVVGLRLGIPHVTYHRVREGESWSDIATRYFGDPKRAFLVIEANGGSVGEPPDVGSELLIPYPLRHVASQGETLPRVASEYYGNAAYARRLRRFNGIRGNRLSRGQVVMVPLLDLELSEEGRKRIAEETGLSPAAGEVRELQRGIDEQLPRLAEHGGEGRFTEVVALGNQLLGAGQLTGNQVVTIQRQLATAYVALGRDDLAVRAFREALERQPDLELDAMRTSPTVMRAFRQARTEHQERQEEKAEAEAEKKAREQPDASAE